MDIAAQGTHGGALVTAQRPGEFMADGWIARSREIDKENRTVQCSCKLIRADAGEVRHGPRTSRRGEGKEEPAAWFEGGKPRGQRVRGAGADDNYIGWLEWAAGAVGVEHGYLRPGFERGARTGREAFFDVDCGDFARRAGEFGEDGRVVTGAAAEMKNAIAGLNAEQVEMNGPQAGLAVVQMLGFVEHDERVAVNVGGVGVGGEAIAAAALNYPGAGPHEAFARHGCEGGEDGRRGDAVEAAQLFGVRAPRGFDGVGHA